MVSQYLCLVLLSMAHKRCSINGSLEQVLYLWIAVPFLLLASDIYKQRSFFQKLVITLWNCVLDVRRRSGLAESHRMTYGSLPERQYFMEMIFRPPGAELLAPSEAKRDVCLWNKFVRGFWILTYEHKRLYLFLFCARNLGRGAPSSLICWSIDMKIRCH